jgi:hypothetical protein
MHGAGWTVTAQPVGAVGNRSPHVDIPQRRRDNHLFDHRLDESFSYTTTKTVSIPTP